MHVEYKGHDEGRNVVFPGGESESLRVSPIGSDLFRLEDSSVLGHACYHDVIRASVRDDGSLVMREIVSRSGLRTQVWAVSKKAIESGEFRELLDYVLSTGGSWERVFGGLLLLHVPPRLARKIDLRMKAVLTKSGV